MIYILLRLLMLVKGGKLFKTLQDNSKLVPMAISMFAVNILKNLN